MAKSDISAGPHPGAYMGLRYDEQRYLTVECTSDFNYALERINFNRQHYDSKSTGLTVYEFGADDPGEQSPSSEKVVSLEEAAKAAYQVEFRGCFPLVIEPWEECHRACRQSYLDRAAAVLDFAGVKYE